MSIRWWFLVHKLPKDILVFLQSPSPEKPIVNDQQDAPSTPTLTLNNQQQATLREFLRHVVLEVDLMANVIFCTEALACSPPLDAEDRKKIATLVGIDLSLLPAKLPGRLALCWTLIVADKDDVVNKIRSGTPVGESSFKDPVAFFEDIGTALGPPKNTQDPASYKLWERHIKALYDLIQESLGSKVLVMLVIVSVDLLKGE